jgi:hypothetical protein
MQAERQRKWYANLTPEQREARRLRQRKDFDHSETMSPEARFKRAQAAGLCSWEDILAKYEPGTPEYMAACIRDIKHRSRIALAAMERHGAAFRERLEQAGVL